MPCAHEALRRMVEWCSASSVLLLLIFGGTSVARGQEAFAGKMYWTLNWPHKIQRANLDGSEVEDIISDGLLYPMALAVDMANGKIYWSDHGDFDDKIRRANLDGSGVEDILFGHLPWALVIDQSNGRLYWSDMNAQKIRRSSLDGSNVEDVVSDVDPAGIALDLQGGYIYWCDNIVQKIRRKKMNSASVHGAVGTIDDVVEDLVSELNYPQGLALGAGKLYWADAGSFKIQRANLDGSEVEDLVTVSHGLKDPYSIAIDTRNEGLIYWTSVGTQYEIRKASSNNSTNAKIQRSSLDGSNIEDLVSSGRRKTFCVTLALPVASVSGDSSCKISSESLPGVCATR